MYLKKRLKLFYDFKETVKQYEAISAADLLETIRMEFSELKAEAFCSLSMAYTWIYNAFWKYNFSWGYDGA